MATFLLEGGDVNVACGVELAVLQVEQGGTGQFGGSEALVVRRGFLEFFDKCIGYHLSGLIIMSIYAQQFGVHGPVLVYLRG